VPFGATARSRLILFGGLYFAQGVPFGFVTGALALRLSGLGPATVGWLLTLAQAPFIFKPLAGPAVDRAGRRRPLLLGFEGAMAVALLVLVDLSPATNRLLFAGAVVALSALAALQDVATDALAIDLLAPGERGRANGVMTAAKYAGSLVGGSGLAWVSSAIGWRPACLAAVALLLAPALMVLVVAEPARPPARPRLAREAVRSFAQRTTALAALFALVSGASDQFLYPVVLPMLQQRLGVPAARIPLLILLAGATSALGNLAGGTLADRFGRRRIIALGAGLLAAAHLGFAAAAPLWLHLPVVLTYLVASALAGGALFAATLALYMDLTNPRVAATQFQIYMALINVRLTWAAAAGGRLGEVLAPPSMFALAAALELAPLALLPVLDARRFRS
jgi:PAT family beta-lactamase induction signal transducer AmpG